MGGNGSFARRGNNAPTYKYSYTDTNQRIEGHKVLISADDMFHCTHPMNSHSPNPTYIYAEVDRDTHQLVVKKISRYEKHKIVESVDLVLDSNGDIVPYNGENGSHMHKWSEDSKGNRTRVVHNKSNIFPIPDYYNNILSKIADFNSKEIIWTN